MREAWLARGRAKRERRRQGFMGVIQKKLTNQTCSATFFSAGLEEIARGGVLTGGLRGGPRLHPAANFTERRFDIASRRAE
jgi:hypothetical protein